MCRWPVHIFQKWSIEEEIADDWRAQVISWKTSWNKLQVKVWSSFFWLISWRFTDSKRVEGSLRWTVKMARKMRRRRGERRIYRLIKSVVRESLFSKLEIPTKWMVMRLPLRRLRRHRGCSMRLGGSTTNRLARLWFKSKLSRRLSRKISIDSVY